ncbi:hypothetical protein DPMN_177268 [Dreissena polymorpha]|uniref:Uncharacterized protein n=1 Tax=Dreissena polymorpha TaxID=45954 RepID=A0A9D4EBE5_DREPO|nr:hypothetical protein DPMN_177268 [Dreissena polymorpha]
MLFNKNVTTKAWSQPSGTLVAGSATLLGDNHQLFQKLTSSANGGGILLSDGSGPLFPSGLPNVISSGSLVWKSPEDLYRCNICDVKFGKLSALQVNICKLEK